MRPPVLVVAVLLLGVCELTAENDVERKLQLLRQLAEESPSGSSQSLAREAGDGSPRAQQASSNRTSAVANVRSHLSKFGTHWRKHAMAQAATALRHAGEALAELQQESQQHTGDGSVVRESESVGSTFALIGASCTEYASYMLFAGMEDGTHADWPRLVSALFSTLWALAELSAQSGSVASVGLAAWMKPVDLRTFARAVVSAVDRGGDLQPQTVLLVRPPPRPPFSRTSWLAAVLTCTVLHISQARYAIAHTMCTRSNRPFLCTYTACDS